MYVKHTWQRIRRISGLFRTLTSTIAVWVKNSENNWTIILSFFLFRSWTLPSDGEDVIGCVVKNKRTRAARDKREGGRERVLVQPANYSSLRRSMQQSCTSMHNVVLWCFALAEMWSMWSIASLHYLVKYQRWKTDGNAPQGCVAKRLRYGGILCPHLIANLRLSERVSKIGQYLMNLWQKLDGLFSDHPVGRSKRSRFKVWTLTGRW